MHIGETTMTVEVTQPMYERIVELLKQEERYRNSDDALIARIWVDELAAAGKIFLHNMTAHSLLKIIAGGKLSSPETIRRNRQKAQEHNPELRGELYGKRKSRETDLINQLKQIET